MMHKLMIILTLLAILIIPANALEISPPAVPDSGADLMPENPESFDKSLIDMIRKAFESIFPEVHIALKTGISLLTIVLILSILELTNGDTKRIAVVAGVLAIASTLLHSTNSMVTLTSDTILELSDYGKLLLPVMTTALAAHGGISSSAALYAGTAAFDILLGNIISRILVPLVYTFLALSMACCALEEEMLKNLRTQIKNTVSWCLKTLLIVFTTYMSITGVVSGTTDAAALKATKVTLSSVVPVVGGILSDASEAILISAEIMKNTAGVYGIFAILSVFLKPFLTIGIQYLTLKVTACLCAVFGNRKLTALIEDFSTAMGLLLAMTGAVCLLLLISTVCFMKGVG